MRCALHLCSHLQGRLLVIALDDIKQQDLAHHRLLHQCYQIWHQCILLLYFHHPRCHWHHWRQHGVCFLPVYGMLQPYCYAPGLILCATHLSVLIFCYIRLTFAYVYHRTALPLILDISAISILSCFRFTDTSWLTCLFGPHFSHSRCPFNSYLPPLFIARVSHFYSYDSDLFCSLLSTIQRISRPISGFLTRLLGLLWLILYMTLSD